MLNWIAWLRNPPPEEGAGHLYEWANRVTFARFTDAGFPFLDNDQTRRLSGMERDETRAVTEADLERALSNVERIGFVGTTERFASSLLGFRRLHGWPLVPVRVRYRQEGRIRAHDLEAEVVEAVRERQRFDVALWEAVQDRWHAPAERTA